MNVPRHAQPRRRHYSAHRQARLDEERYAKLGELTKTFHEHRRFMLRLNNPLLAKLETLTQRCHRSAAEIIRQLISQANPEDFPRGWQMATEECHKQLAP
jgi:hypothetical protein